MEANLQQLTRTFAALIAGHADLVNRQRATAEKTSHDPAMLPKLLDGFQEARAAWEAKQVVVADDFNLFEVMGIADDEVTHSKILAWLLDRRLEYGSHAQGNLGFRLFLQELGADLGADSSPQVTRYPDEPYWVRCEVCGDESRVDIEIAARGKFIIHIENKIGASEGEDQTHREWRDLKRRANELAIPLSNIHAIFLTLDACSPANRHFLAVGWHRIVNVLERFADQAQAEEVRLFAAHYGKAIRMLALMEPGTEQNRDEAQSV